MTSRKKDKKKEKLLSTLAVVKKDAKELTQKGRETIEQAQFVHDLASCTEEFIRCVPNDSALPGDAWEGEASMWNHWHERAQSFSIEISGIEALSSATDAAALTTSSVISEENIHKLPNDSQSLATNAKDKFYQLIAESNLYQQVKQYQIQLKEYILSKDSNDPESLHLLSPNKDVVKNWKTVSRKPVDFDTVPKFQERDLGLGQSLKLAIWDIGLLALFNLVFFAASFVSFLRYDVR